MENKEISDLINKHESAIGGLMPLFQDYLNIFAQYRDRQEEINNSLIAEIKDLKQKVSTLSKN